MQKQAEIIAQEVFVVVSEKLGYAREDASTPNAVGVFNDKDIADRVRKCAGFGSSVVPLKMNDILPGYLNYGKELGVFPKDFVVHDEFSRFVPEIEFIVFDEVSGNIAGIGTLKVVMGKKPKTFVIGHAHFLDSGKADVSYTLPKSAEIEDLQPLSALLSEFKRQAVERAAAAVSK